MADSIKVALITHEGGAHMGTYLSTLKSAPDCDEVVLADPDGRWAEQAKRVLGEKLTGVHDSVDGMLRQEQPRMAVVTMEAVKAPPVIETVLNAGVHVFAEKPACVRAEDFAKLVDLADRKHLNLMLAFANRANPETIEARRLIARGIIGDIYGLEMHLIADQTRLTRPSYQKEWFTHKERSGGGHLIWLGIHWLDLAMHVTGSDIEQVSGFIANVGGQPIDIEDAATAALKFENGSLGTLTSGYFLDRGYHSHIKVWGSRGWLHLEPMKDRPLRWSTSQGSQAGKIQEFEGPISPRGYAPYIHSAITACAKMSEPPISNADSLRALQTVFAIYDAAATGRTITVSPEA